MIAEAAEFDDMMPSRCNLFGVGTKNQFGRQEPVGVATGIPCHVEGSNKLVRTGAGVEVVSTTQVYLNGVYGAVADGGLEVDGEPMRQIISVDTNYDDVGPHHQVCYL